MNQKRELYDDMANQMRGLFAGERDLIANTANLSALIWQMLPDLNWAGFYFRKGNQLVLGPFQGKPACVRIAVGRGVCGKAVAEAKTVVVPDVHAFADHIACDAASNSEIAVPLIRHNLIFGVLDLDSPIFNRFDNEDAAGLEALARTLMLACD